MAELVILEEPSTGAENDLQAATARARNMVERSGMADEVGPVSLARPTPTGVMAAGRTTDQT